MLFTFFLRIAVLRIQQHELPCHVSALNFPVGIFFTCSVFCSWLIFVFFFRMLLAAFCSDRVAGSGRLCFQVNGFQATY